MKKVIVLFGGESAEHEVSVRSAKFIFDNIDRNKYECIPIGISKDGRWYFYKEDRIVYNWIDKNIELVSDIVKVIQSVDVVFPIIHGAYGEDGRIQALCELFHVKYVGCDSKTSMICMDKEYTKIIAEHHKVPIVSYSLNEINKYPVVVKPANGGSSIGIGIATNEQELKERYKEARKYDNKVIFEEYKKVRELEVAVIEKENKFYISGIGEIITEGEIYDYCNKYVNSKNTILKADIPKKIRKKVYKLVEKLVIIFDVRGLSRVDFFYVEEENAIYFNEINTLPGFTAISMYPALLKKAKLSNKEIVSILIESS